MISCGLYHTVLLNEAGEVYVWGDNSFGQLGIGSASNKEIPVKVEGLEDIVMVSAGAYHTLALTRSGEVYAWGRNTYGQVGNGTTMVCGSPVKIADIPAMTAVSAGAFHSMALAADGTVYAWGDNTYGQVGNVDSEVITDSSGNVLGSRVLKPLPVAGPGIAAISAGGSHSLYLDASGKVFAWGDNSFGQLGDGTQISHNTPAPVAGLSSVTMISAGYMYNMAVRESTAGSGSQSVTYQNLFTWGSDSSGQLGLGAEPDQDSVVLSPVRVDAGGDADETNDRISLIDAGYYSSVMTVPVTVNGLRRDSVYVWGNNSYGQLGIGSMPSQYEPVRLIGTSNGWQGDTFVPFESISAGGYNTALLSVKGFAGITGRADKGQLGNVSSIGTDRFLGVAVRDAIAPEWKAGAALTSKFISSYLQLSWEDAADNIGVTGYRLTYVNKKGETVTVKLGAVRDFTILDLDKTFGQTITLRAIDNAGNRSEFPLFYTIGTSSSGDASSIADPASGSDASSAAVSEPDASSRPAALYAAGALPEVPWDVDYLYGAGVVKPPPDRTIYIAVGITVLVFLLFILFSFANFRRTHKGHRLFRSFLHHGEGTDEVSQDDSQTAVDIGNEVRILQDGQTHGADGADDADRAGEARHPDRKASGHKR